MDFMLGSDYENIRPLDAKGGMGDLFRAHKKGLDVEVVIKRISANTSAAWISRTRLIF